MDDAQNREVSPLAYANGDAVVAPTDAEVVDGLEGLAKEFKRAAKQLKKAAKRAGKAEKKNGSDPDVRHQAVMELMQAVGEHRRSMRHWEHVLTEFGLHYGGMSHREAAGYLDVGSSTVGRRALQPRLAQVPSLEESDSEATEDGGDSSESK